MYKTNKRPAAVHLTADSARTIDARQGRVSSVDHRLTPTACKKRECAKRGLVERLQMRERAWARACLQSHEHSQYPRGVSRLAALEGSLSPSRRGPSGQPEVAVRTLPLHTVLNLTLPRAVLWHHMCCMCGSTGKGLNGAILVTAVRDVGRRQHGVPSVST